MPNRKREQVEWENENGDLFGNSSHRSRFICSSLGALQEDVKVIKACLSSLGQLSSKDDAKSIFFNWKEMVLRELELRNRRLLKT